MAEDELTKDEIDNISKGSKYLTTAPGYKSKFDVVDILTNGNIPEFGNEADKLVCAFELGSLIRKTGLGTGKNNLLKLMSAIDVPHRVILFQRLSLQQIELMCQDPDFKDILGEITDVVRHK